METYCMYELNMGWINFGEKEIVFTSKKMFGEWNKFYITDYYNIKYADFEKGSTSSALIIETNDKKFKFNNITNVQINYIKDLINSRKGDINYKSDQNIKGVEVLKERTAEANKKSNSLMGAGISIIIAIIIFWWLFRSCGIL